MSRAVAFWIALLFAFSGGVVAWMGWKNLRQNAHGSVSVVDQDTSLSERDRLTEFELIDQTGTRFDSREMKGKVWVGSIFFASCPSTCFNQNIKIQELQVQFADRGLELVSITCDPENDSAAVLARYSTRFNADPNVWRFLTSTTSDMEYIQQIANDYFSLAVHKGTHSDRAVLFDRQGEIVGAFSVLNPKQFLDLKNAIEELLEEGMDDWMN